MLSSSLPWSSMNQNIPTWVIVNPNGDIEFDGKIWPSFEKCCVLKNQEIWNQHNTVINSWINQASDEDIFKYLRRDFSQHLSSIYPSSELEEEMKIRALNFIWSKNPELQQKYPNFEGISTLTEAQKIWYSPKTNNPWIWLSFMGNDKTGHLSIFTRPSEQDEFTENFYLIHEDGRVKFHLSQTQSEQEISRKKHETSQKVLNILIDEANGDLLKIANAFLADAMIQTVKHNSKKK